MSWEGFFYFCLSNSQLYVSSDSCSVYRPLCGILCYTHAAQHLARDSREPLQILSYFSVEPPLFQSCPAIFSCLSLFRYWTGSVAALHRFNRKPWAPVGLTSFISLL